MHNIEEFVDRLIQDKGFNEQNPDVIAQMRLDLIDRVENRINAMILSNIKPENIESFKRVLDEGSEKQIQEFVKNDVPDIDEKVATELLTFKYIYLG